MFQFALFRQLSLQLALGFARRIVAQLKFDPLKSHEKVFDIVPSCMGPSISMVKNGGLSVSPVDPAIGAPVATGQDENSQDNATDCKGDGDERRGEPSDQ